MICHLKRQVWARPDVDTNGLIIQLLWMTLDWQWLDNLIFTEEMELSGRNIIKLTHKQKNITKLNRQKLPRNSLNSEYSRFNRNGEKRRRKRKNEVSGDQPKAFYWFLVRTLQATSKKKTLKLHKTRHGNKSGILQTLSHAHVCLCTVHVWSIEHIKISITHVIA